MLPVNKNWDSPDSICTITFELEVLQQQGGLE